MARGGSSQRSQGPSIKDLLKRHVSQPPSHHSEEDDLRTALQLSKQEQINEQKRIFEQLARLSRTRDQPPNRLKKRRLIQMDNDEEEEEEDAIVKGRERKEADDEDQWFQTVSSRSQQSNRLLSLSKSKSKSKKKIIEKTPVKKEPEKNQILLDIDDTSALITKEEEESYDLTSLLQEESDTGIAEDRNDHRSLMETTTTNAGQMISDSDSDCSVIDLVEGETDSNIPQQEDDGYLSPLEGFTSLNDVRDDEAYNNYYNQFRSTATTTSNRKKRSTNTTSTPKKKKFYKRKVWFRKKK